jgi:hypothetical protein
LLPKRHEQWASECSQGYWDNGWTHLSRFRILFRHFEIYSL